MTSSELFEVIVTFEDALKKKKIPKFKNCHRAEQVLRILKVDFHDFGASEERRACNDETRDLWEKFWDYPEIKKHVEAYTKQQKFIEELNKRYG